MASSIDSQSLSQFKCHSCDSIPTEHQVSRCARGHIVCLKCHTQYGRCKCASVNLVRVPNPLVQIVVTTKKEKIACAYKDNGCSWIIVDPADADDHHAECKFRPSRCVGSQLEIWTCDWTGLQHEFPSHMKQCHSDNGEFFTHWQAGSVHFDPYTNCKKFNLIDAFNKKFVFLYMSLARSPNIVFIIYLLGRKVDAQKYMIDFELKDELRKVKIIENCYSDADSIAAIIKDHRCFMLPKKLVESYAKNGELEFRFVIKKKDGVELENIEKQQHLLNNVLHGDGQNPVPQFASKTQMKANQSETNLYSTAGQNRSIATNKPRYHRKPSK